jgi:hypothetical protein
MVRPAVHTGQAMAVRLGTSVGPTRPSESGLMKCLYTRGPVDRRALPELKTVCSAEPKGAALARPLRPSAGRMSVAPWPHGQGPESTRRPATTHGTASLARPVPPPYAHWGNIDIGLPIQCGSDCSAAKTHRWVQRVVACRSTGRCLATGHYLSPPVVLLGLVVVCRHRPLPVDWSLCISTSRCLYHRSLATAPIVLSLPIVIYRDRLPSSGLCLLRLVVVCHISHSVRTGHSVVTATRRCPSDVFRRIGRSVVTGRCVYLSAGRCPSPPIIESRQRFCLP